MARHLRIRHIVTTDQARAHELVHAICGVNPDGTHWTLTKDQAVAQVENGVAAFYMEGPRAKRFDVIVVLDFRANKYLKAVADSHQSNELLFLPTCLHFAHSQNGRSWEAKACR